MKSGLLTALGCGAALCLAGAADAQTVTFDFENLPVASLGQLAFTRDGLTLTVNRPPLLFNVADVSALGGPSSFGRRSLSPFNAETSSIPFVFSFAAPLYGVSIDFGDFGDDADTFTVTGFTGINGTGSTAFTIGGSLPGGGSSFTGGTAAATSTTPFQSLTVIGGSSNFPNSVYFDNIRVALTPGAVPEPATWAMMIGGFGMIGCAMRSARRKTAPATA